MKHMCLAVVVAVIGLGAVPAEATAVCVETNRVRFSPPLTRTSRSGIVEFDFIKQCVDGSGAVYSAAGDGLTFGYTGTCLAAVVAQARPTFIVGGTVWLDPEGTLNATDAKNGVLVPDSLDPCNFATGTFQGVKID